MDKIFTANKLRLVMFHIILYLIFSILYGMSIHSELEHQINEYKRDEEIIRRDIAIEEDIRPYEVEMVEIHKELSERQTAWSDLGGTAWGMYIDQLPVSRLNTLGGGLYYGMIVHTTIGFGDIYPVNGGVRTLTMFHAALVFIGSILLG